MDLLPGADPGFVKIIHPETGGVAEVSELGLAQWWVAGWVPLTAENAPPGEPGAGSSPPALTEAQVAQGLTAKPDAKAGVPPKSKSGTAGKTGE